MRKWSYLSQLASNEKTKQKKCHQSFIWDKFGWDIGILGFSANIPNSQNSANFEDFKRAQYYQLPMSDWFNFFLLVQLNQMEPENDGDNSWFCLSAYKGGASTVQPLYLA